MTSITHKPLAALAVVVALALAGPVGTAGAHFGHGHGGFDGHHGGSQGGFGGHHGAGHGDSGFGNPRR